MKRLLCLLAALAVLLPRGHAAEPRCVALTFDDGPSGALTERLLDGLAARGVHATFFLCGYRIDLYPELAARIAAEGHETGTHGDTHSYFTSMSRAEVCRDLAEARRKLMEATGRAPTLLRPPGGLYDTAVLQQTALRRSACHPLVRRSGGLARARCRRRDGTYPAPRGAGVRDSDARPDGLERDGRAACH